MTITANSAVVRAVDFAGRLFWLSIQAAQFFLIFLSLQIAVIAVTYSPLAPWLAILLFFPFVFFLIFVHELGHAVAAMLTGRKVHAMVVKPIGYRPQARKFFRPKSSLSGDVGGWVLATREGHDGDIIYFLGGSLGNFMLSAMAYVIAFPTSEPMTATVAGSIAVASAAVGCTNLIPTRSPTGRKNDGAQVLDRLRGNRPSDAAERMSRLTGIWFDETPPALWDAELLKTVETDTLGEGQRNLRDTMVVNRYLVLGNVKAAKRTCERAASEYGVFPALRADHAFLSAFVDGDAGVATVLLQNVPAQYQQTFNYFRAKAVVLALQQDYQAARRVIGQAREAARKQKQRPDADDEAIFDAIEEERPLPKIDDIARRGARAFVA